MTMTHDDTAVLVTRLSRELPTILPGVTFCHLAYCDWLAFSELQLATNWSNKSPIPMDFLVKLYHALGRLSQSFPWKAIDDLGEIQAAGTEILDHMATYVSSAPIVPKVIYWGCFVLGPRIAFVYCRSGQVPPAFLPASSPLTQESP